MSNIDKETLTQYIKDNPDLSYSEIASCVISDKASSLSHRTLRLYAKLIKEEMDTEISDPDAEQFPADMTIPQADNADILELEEDVEVPLIVKKTPKLAKVLVLDIETSLIEAYLFDTGKQFIGSDQLKNSTFVIGWSAKWLSDSKTISDFVTPAEALARDDKRVVASAWSLLNEADYVVGHNVSKFDTNVLRLRSIYHKLDPFLPFKTIDTLTFAKKYLKAPGLSLNFLAQLLCNKAKIKTERQLWIDISNGSQKAIDEMKTYCINDVGLTEEVYFEMRPFMPNHPNIAVLTDDDHPTCPVCGSYDFDVVDKYYTTPQNAYQMVRCTNCKTPARLRTSIVSPEKRKKMVVPVAR